MEQSAERHGASGGAATPAHYVIVGLFAAVSSEFSRSRWPAHVTLASNFMTRATPAEIMNAVRRVKDGSAIVVEFGGRALFGPNGDIPVRLVLPGPVIELHHALAGLLEPLPDFRADEPAYWRDGYRPHLTLGPLIAAKEGTHRAITSIALARLDGDTAAVLDILPLSEVPAPPHVIVRRAGPEDAPELAFLKTQWAALERDPSEMEKDAFAIALADWMVAQGDSLVVMIAVDRDVPAGMAWMVVFERVPDFGDRHRLTADIQSVYVTPDSRGRGIGTRLIDELCREADRRDIPRILVTASAGSLALYQRAGFRESALLLQR